MFSFTSKSSKPGWLTILLSDKSVALVHVVRTPGLRPEVRLLEVFSLESGEKNSLRRLRTTRLLNAYACTTLLSRNEYALMALEAPAVPKEERTEALRWALKDFVDFPVDKACLAVLDIPTITAADTQTGSVLVLAADETLVKKRAAAFVDAKLNLRVIDVPEMAQRNIAALFEDENRALVFVNLDAAGMTLTLNFGGELMTARNSELNSTQMNASDPTQRANARERLILDLQRSLDSFERQYSQTSVSKVLFAAHPKVDNLLEELAQNLDLPVQEMDLTTKLDFSSIPELKDLQYQAKHMLAIGAALRDGEA